MAKRSAAKLLLSDYKSVSFSLYLQYTLILPILFRFNVHRVGVYYYIIFNSVKARSNVSDRSARLLSSVDRVRTKRYMEKLIAAYRRLWHNISINHTRVRKCRSVCLCVCVYVYFREFAPSVHFLNRAYIGCILRR